MLIARAKPVADRVPGEAPQRLLATYAGALQQAMAAAERAERLRRDLARAAALLKKEMCGP